MTSDRPYAPRRDAEEALVELRNAGMQLDPIVVGAVETAGREAAAAAST